MIKNEFYNKHGNSRDMSRIELGRMVTNLRKELKEQIEENKELEKKNDGLVTVIDLVKDYVERNMTYETCERRFCVPEGKDILEILERVNEE